MNSPIQAAPVVRGAIRALQIQSITQQGCNPIVCGIATLGCAVACADTLGAACVACLGPLYGSCKDCF